MSFTLSAIFDVFKRKWHIAAALLLVPVVLAFLVVHFVFPPKYSATMTMNFHIAITEDPDGFFGAESGNSLIEQQNAIMIGIETHLLRDTVLQAVIDEANFFDYEATLVYVRSLITLWTRDSFLQRHINLTFTDFDDENVLRFLEVYQRVALPLIIDYQNANQNGLFTFEVSYDHIILPDEATSNGPVSYMQAILMGAIIGFLAVAVLLLYPVLGRVNKPEDMGDFYEGKVYGKIPLAKAGGAAGLSEHIDSVAAKINLSLGGSAKNIAVTGVNAGDGASAIAAGLSVSEAGKPVVFKDAGTILKSADALIACSGSDGVVLVVSAGTKKSAVKDALMSLDIAKAELCGVVLNKVL